MEVRCCRGFLVDVLRKLLAKAVRAASVRSRVKSLGDVEAQSSSCLWPVGLWSCIVKIRSELPVGLVAAFDRELGRGSAMDPSASSKQAAWKRRSRVRLAVEKIIES